MADRNMIRELLHTVLLAAEAPVHIDTLVATLRPLNAFPEEWDDKKAGHELYCVCWYELKSRGDESRWRRVGKGMWCAVEHLTVDLVLTEEKHAPRTMDDIRLDMRLAGREPRPKAEEVPLDQRRCGNCTHIVYYGPHELTLMTGECRNPLESGKEYTQSKCDASRCVGYQPRSEDKKASDRERQRQVRARVDGINLACAHSNTRRRTP